MNKESTLMLGRRLLLGLLMLVRAYRIAPNGLVHEAGELKAAVTA